MSKIPAGELYNIEFQDNVDAFPLRENFANIRNRLNETVDQISAVAIGTTNAETTSARPYHTALVNRLDQMGQNSVNFLIAGGLVEAQSVPDMTVQISSGTANTGGIAVNWTSANSSSFSAPTNKQYVIIVINSDNTLTGVLGSDVTDPVLPSIAITQRPLGYFLLESSTIAITDSMITDISKQGCIVENNWFFSIIDAVNSLGLRANAITDGQVTIQKGDYYEEVDLTGKSNITLNYQNGARHFRPTDSEYCIKAINTITNEETGLKIIGGDFRGNSKTGAIELLKFDFVDKFEISSCKFDGNVLSTATFKDWIIDNGDDFRLDRNTIDDYSASTSITNATKYLEDGYFMGQVVYAGTTAQKTELVKMGFTELVAMANKFPRVESTAGNTGGDDGSSHNHQWYQANSTSSNDETFNSGGGEVFFNPQTTTGGKRYMLTANGNTNQGLEDYYTSNVDPDNKPAFYSLIALIHR